MVKRSSKKEDIAAIRAVIQREMANGHSFDEAAVKAYQEAPDIYNRIVGRK